MGALKPGAIVVFKTADGNCGKFQVIRYRPIYDFSFAEAAQLPPQWRYLALSGSSALRPSQGNGLVGMFYRIRRHFVRDPRLVRNYHLELRWRLFDGQSNKVPPTKAATAPLGESVAAR